jgi:ATP-dependent DNA helicase RecQ
MKHNAEPGGIIAGTGAGSRLDPENQHEPAYDDPLGDTARRLFGLSYLFPYQRLVMANLLEAAAGGPAAVPDAGLPAAENAGGREDYSDRDSLGRQIVILPTGAGKSLCFQLPAMILEGITLVIYPILSLMADQERRLKERGFSPIILRGGQGRDEREKIWEQLRSARRIDAGGRRAEGERTAGGRFLIANPEVLLTPGVLEQLGKLPVVHVVIDEAHCVSEWGESFRPAYLRIAEIIDAVSGESRVPLVTAFTATASAPVLEKIERYIFGGRGARRIIGSPDRSNISYAAQGCILRNLAVRDLIFKNPPPVIVFCSSRRGTEQLARYLRNELSAGSPEIPEVRFYHAGLSREEKNEIEGWFFPNPRGILVSTCAYGMGVDKADIRTVIHRDCPPSVEAYLQESGRAGRDGKPSRAILLWGPEDEAALRRAKSPAEERRLTRLLAYARNNRDCRRGALLDLLNYEDPGGRPESGCCDVCDGTARGDLREEQSILAFFRRNRRSYTMTEAADILARGESAGWTEDDALRAIRELVKMKKLRVCGNIFWKRKLTPA